MAWLWTEARKATVTLIVGSVLLPYLSRWLPVIGKHMTSSVSFTVGSTLTPGPVSFTLPMWVLAAIALVVLSLLVNTIRLFGGREVRVCTYCTEVIGPFERRMVIPHATSELAHPDCYRRAIEPA